MKRLNWNRQFALEQAADDAELLQELLELFKGTCAKDITLIKDGLQQNNAQQVRAAAHSIKGAAASLGIDGIRAIALTIETAARADDLTVAGEQLLHLETLGEELQHL